MKTIKCTFETTGEALDFPAKAVEKIQDRNSLGSWVDRTRNHLKIPAPIDPRDFAEMVRRAA